MMPTIYALLISLSVLPSLVSGQAAREAEQIVLTDLNDKQIRRRFLRREMMDLVQDVGLGSKFDLAQFHFLGIGGELESKKLSPQQVLTDAFKLSRPELFNSWAETTFSARFFLSDGVSLLEEKGGALNLAHAIGVGGGLRKVQTYTIRTPSTISQSESSGPIASIFSQLQIRVDGALKVFKIPFDPRELIARFPVGSEIIKVGDHDLNFSLTSFGLGSGATPIGARASLGVSVHRPFKRVVQILEARPGKKLVRLRYESIQSHSKNFSSALGHGVSLKAVGIDNLGLGVDVARFRIQHTKDVRDSIEFIIDPSFPDAANAFRQAMRSDLRGLQKLAAAEHDSYEGVLMRGQSLGSVRSLRTQMGLGAFLDRVGLDLGFIQARARPSLVSDLIALKWQSRTTHSVKETTTGQEEVTIVAKENASAGSFDFLFNQLISREKNQTITNSLIQRKVNVPMRTASPKISHQVSFDLNSERKGGGKKQYHQFEAGLQSLTITQQDPSGLEQFQQLDARSQCRKNIRFQRTGILELKHVDSIFLLSPSELAAVFGRFLGDKQWRKWKSVQERKKRLLFYSRLVGGELEGVPPELASKTKELFLVWRVLRKKKTQNLFANPAALFKGDQASLPPWIPSENKASFFKLDRIFKLIKKDSAMLDFLVFVAAEHIQKLEAQSKGAKEKAALRASYNFISDSCRYDYSLDLP